MQNFYLLRWLKEAGEADPRLLDLLKYELDKRIYYYGAQFARPYESPALKGYFGSVRSSLKNAVLNLKRENGEWKDGLRICSSAYFSFNNALESCGFSVRQVPWKAGKRLLGDDNLYSKLARARYLLDTADFKVLLSPDFSRLVWDLREGMKRYFVENSVAALVVPYDLPFFERLAVDIFKELARPTFVALHGLPGRYNCLDDNRADYLLVWGDAIKANYAAAGVMEGKIFVTGHPDYGTLPNKISTGSLDRVLVISKSMGGAQHSSEVVLSDRGNLPLYLYSVRRALRGLGVKSARLRLHPSESADWYSKFLDGDFYQFDRGPLGKSLENASLVIGPTSTVFVEAMLAGKEYVVYEPAAEGRDLINYLLVPPFDGSLPGLSAVCEERALRDFLASSRQVSTSVLGGYIRTPFDISFIRGLVPERL